MGAGWGIAAKVTECADYRVKKSYLWNAQKENDELIRKIGVWKRSRQAQGKPIHPIWWLPKR